MILRSIIFNIITFAYVVSILAQEDCGNLDFSNSIRKGLWNCAKEIAQKSQSTGGSELRGIFDAESRLIQKELASLKSVLDSSIPQNSITPAFQWAQGANEIFLNIKFSHKIDAPATLNVEANNVTLSNDTLFLLASDGRKLFKLHITFLHEIIPEESSWSMASVGRMTFTIKKLQTEPIKWKRLLKSDKKHAQMHYWFEMAENYKNELEQIEIDRENRLKQLKEEEAKARAEKEEAEKKEIELKDQQLEEKIENETKEAEVKAEVDELVSKFTKSKEKNSEIKSDSKPSMFSFFNSKKENEVPPTPTDQDNIKNAEGTNDGGSSRSNSNDL